MREAYLSGRLGADPEVASPQSSEYSVLKMRIANNDQSKKTDSGEYEDVTNWFDVEFWTKKPQDWLQKLYKGYEVIVSCEVKQDRWEKDGQTRSKVKFVVKRGTFPYVIPSKGGNVHTGSQPPQQQNTTEYQDDDMPF